MKYKIYNIDPYQKPRMIKGSKSVSINHYWAFKNNLNLLKFDLPESGYHIIFVKPMPVSWTLKKKKSLLYKPHQQVPDKDNLEKSVLDCIFKNDSHIWDGRVSKLWGRKGAIIVITGIDTDWISGFVKEALE